MKIAYIRVSTVEQNEQRQINNMQNLGIEKYFIEKKSAKDTNRPKLQECLNFVREGDTLYVDEFSRIARNTKDLLSITEFLQKKGIKFVSLKENINTETAAGKLLLTILGSIAEFERSILLERQKEGIAAAKRAGRYSGRKQIKIDLLEFENLLEKYNTRKLNKVQFAKKLNISRALLDQVLQEYANKDYGRFINTK